MSRKFRSGLWYAVMLVLVIAPYTPGQQVACQSGVAFPAPAIDMPLGSRMTASDMYLAVSPYRIALTTNVTAQLRCRSGGSMSGSSSIPLRGADLASGLFVTEPAQDYDYYEGNMLIEVRRRIFDPRVIYDNYDQRFWVVASEDDYPSFPYNVLGRIHLGSKDPPPGVSGSKSSPNSWTGNHWIKCTHGQGANKPPIDLQSDLGFPATFPDRCSIAVDKDHLFISYRESPAQGPLSPTVILVLAKSNIL